MKEHRAVQNRAPFIGGFEGKRGGALCNWGGEYLMVLHRQVRTEERQACVLGRVEVVTSISFLLFIVGGC